MSLSTLGPQVWASALACWLWVLEQRNESATPSCCFRMEWSLSFGELVGENGDHPPALLTAPPPPRQGLLSFCGLSFPPKAVLGCACPFLFRLGPAHSGDPEIRPHPKEASRLQLSSRSCPSVAPGQCPVTRGRQASLSRASVWLCVSKRVCCSLKSEAVLAQWPQRVPLPHQDQHILQLGFHVVRGHIRPSGGGKTIGPMGPWRPICGGKRGQQTASLKIPILTLSAQTKLSWASLPETRPVQHSCPAAP